MNYLAVRSVSMRTLNRQRANIAFSHLLAYDKALRPNQVAETERIFERDGILRWATGQSLGYCHVGATFQKLCHPSSGLLPSMASKGGSLNDLMTIYREESYTLWPEKYRPTFHILLKQGCGGRETLKAWLQALMLAKKIAESKSTGEELADPRTKIRLIESTLRDTNKIFADYVKRLQALGWDMDSAMLETQCGPRFCIAGHNSN